MTEITIIYSGPVVTRAEAIERGAKWFFVADICIHGHIDKRKTSTGQCYQCARESAHRNYHKDVEAGRKKCRKHYQTNVEKLKKRAAESLKSNPERRERRRRQSAEWYRKNKDRATHYRQERNPLYAVHARNRRSKLIGKHTIEEVNNLLAKQKHKCANCKVSIRKNCHIDHVLPIFLGGMNTIDNLEGLCGPCNLKKNKKHPLVWARLNGRLL